MLGATVENIGALRWPLLGSPKLDGIRAIWLEGQFFSRTMKPIPNQALTIAMQELEDQMGGMYAGGLNGLDGELIYGDPCDKLCFNKTTSAVMTRNAPPDFIRFYVFDRIDLTGTKTFSSRIQEIPRELPHCVEVLQQTMLLNSLQLVEFEEATVAQGYEGVILRHPAGKYKQGRSTFNEHGLLKVKRFKDAEATVVGFEELMHNDNEAKLDERGYSKRSSHKENKVPMGTLGSLQVKWKNVVFNIGSGFTQEWRDRIWKNQKNYLGKLVKFKYLEVGLLNAPRHPVFLGFRQD